MRFLAFLLALCAGSAWADAQYLWATPASSQGTYARGVVVPNTRDGGNWPMTVNVYYPSGTVSRAVVLLPGATGNADDVCSQFRACLANPVTNTAQVNWAVLNGYNTAVISINSAYANGGLDKCVAARTTASISGTTLNVTAVGSSYYNVAVGMTPVVAGVSKGVTVLAFGTNGTTGTGGTGTYALSGDAGTVASTTIVLQAAAPTTSQTTTTCNFSESSGQDDLEFYIELSDWISGGCGGNCGSGIGTAGTPGAKNIVGFSNGGMFVDRLWCYNDSRYAHYVSVSGPEPSELSTKGCTAPTPRPYLAFYGGQDPDLGIYVSGASHWTDSTWTSQNPNRAQLSSPSTYISAPIYFCEFSRQYGGSPACAGSGASIPAYGSGGFNAVATHNAVSSGFADIYCYGGATCPMELYFIYNGGHSPLQQAAALGYSELSNVIIPWIRNN